MKYIYAPGCALMSYKPHLADKLKALAVSRYGEMDTLLACCITDPVREEGIHVLTPCVTCAVRYKSMWSGSTSDFLLDMIADSEDFPFPDYGGAVMSIQDTCASRTMPQAQATIRKLLEKMNIRLEEPEKSGPVSKCCGQSFYGKLDPEKVRSLMVARAAEMPTDDVVVYCPSCIVSMAQGGKKPRYILDLLFGETTELRDSNPYRWHCRLMEFRSNH